MATLSANESPAPSRRSRHSKSQSTSALSTILDIPRQRGSIPPVPALPSEIPSSSRRQPFEPYRSGRDARLPTLPGLTDSSDLSDGGSSTTNSYDSPSTSRRSTHTSSITRSRTYQDLEDPGSPTPKRSRARAMDDLKTRNDGPLATPQASPSKKRSHKDRTDGLNDLGVQRRPSRRRGDAGSPRKDVQRSRAVSKERGLKEELAESAAIIESHRTSPSTRLQTLETLQKRLASLAPSRLPLTEKTRGAGSDEKSELEVFISSGIHRSLLDLLCRHAAVLPHLPQMLPQRVEMLDEIQLLAGLLQGLCLLEGFVSVEDDCRAALRETRVFEILTDLLRATYNDTLAYHITPSLLDLVYSILAAPTSRANPSPFIRFAQIGGIDVLENIVICGHWFGPAAYDLTKFITLGFIESTPAPRRKVSTDRSTSEGSFDSMTTGRSGTSDRRLMTPVTDESDGRSSRASSVDVDNTPRTPRKRDSAVRVAPATTHSSSKTRLLPKSATSSALSGFYTPSARGEKRHFNRGTREDSNKLGRVLEEDAVHSPALLAESPTIPDFGSDLDDTMHSTMRGGMDVFGLPQSKTSERKLPRTRSTMGPEIVARASPSKSGLGKGLPSGLSSDTPRGLRTTSSELVRPGSRLKKARP
ncbi:hypothetical protein HD553DRAFT_349994 [Filobasidium floriforme]|uniref:uncharacterized protein n=1 Tax=Filobasidium floriforme TaxID=5210 RepID=UPI001E8EB80D|nr:uncharacterized protein HD553DRAFT_349994 [Filobasidium floriforme]KAH8085399.1 hypothetical protein HD553DRAFT_349994 [Filobasidium floriforme]